MKKNSKTKKLLSGAVVGMVTVGLAGCSGDPDLPPPPDNPECDDYEWDDNLGVWECDDYDSRYYGHFFYGGSIFKNKSSLTQSSAYKSYKSSSSFKSGFGSSGKGVFGG